MKRLLTLIALALLPVIGFAQDNGLGRLSEDETGHYTMTMDMGPMKIVSEGWFIDYGARSRTEMVVMGEKVVTIKINDKMYMISPQFREVPSSQTVNFNNLTPDVIEQYDIKKLDKELHELFHFILGSGPILSREGIHGKILYTVSSAVTAELLEVLGACPVSGTSRKVSFCIPSSVAVHYYTQRYGDLKVTRIISFFFFVSE